MQRTKTVSKNNSKAMYINSDGDLFIQLRENGCYLNKNGTIYVRLGDYIAFGELFRKTKSGIALRDWRIEHEHFFTIPD